MSLSFTGDGSQGSLSIGGVTSFKFGANGISAGDRASTMGWPV